MCDRSKILIYVYVAARWFREHFQAPMKVYNSATAQSIRMYERVRALTQNPDARVIFHYEKEHEI